LDKGWIRTLTAIGSEKCRRLSRSTPAIGREIPVAKATYQDLYETGIQEGRPSVHLSGKALFIYVIVGLWRDSETEAGNL